MNSPATPKPETPPLDEIIAQAARLTNLQRSTAYHALQSGVIPDEILSYVRGNSPDGFESVLGHSAWAMDRVVALVKAQRRPNSLGAKILASVGRTDPYVWGIKDTGDRDLDLAALLNRV